MLCSRRLVEFGETVDAHVKDCCRSVGCRASTLSEWELCLVCGVVVWCGVVWPGNRLAADWGRMK